MKFIEAKCKGCGIVSKVNLDYPCPICKTHDYQILDTSKGTLYTSCYSKIKNKKFKGIVITISRLIPEDFIIEDNTIIDKNLAPSEKLLYDFKCNRITWEEYVRRYEEEYNDDKIYYIQKLLDEGHDVVLLCFCSSDKYCHRRLVRKKFERLNYKVKEL